MVMREVGIEENNSNDPSLCEEASLSASVFSAVKENKRIKIHRDKNALEENTNSDKNAVIIQNNGEIFFYKQII